MKRSMLFGVLAMFAVSAMSVQNLNAQNEVKTNQAAQQSINDPKAKEEQQVGNAEQSPVKGENGKVTNDTKLTNGGQVTTNGEEPPMRSVMNPQGQKEVSVQKEEKKDDVMDRTTGNNNLKKSRPKKVAKNQAMQDNTQSGVQKPNQNQQGKPGMKKPSKNETIKNEAQSSQAQENQHQDGYRNDTKKNKVNNHQKMPDGTQAGQAQQNQHQQGNDNPKPAIQKPGQNGKIKNNVQAGQAQDNQHQDGYSNDTKKNKTKPTLQKDEPKEQPNSVVRPRQKVNQGTSTGNNNGAL